MRVLFSSTRGAGHFLPLVPVIEACRRRGHEVLAAGSRYLAVIVEGTGYDFWGSTRHRRTSSRKSGRACPR